MKFAVITIFPEAVREYLKIGVLSRAVEQGLVQVEAYDLREFSGNQYNKIDDYVFGHGRGMLFRPQPLQEAINAVKKNMPDSKVIFLTPQGKKFDNHRARSYASEKGIILIAARYEGIDARIVQTMVDEEISMGDYVMTGGELPALGFIDAVSRFLEGTIKKESAGEESFESGLVEYEHYTQPVEFEEMKVPDELRSGDHAKINEFRLRSGLRKTYFNRPDLWRDYVWDMPEKKPDQMKTTRKRNQQLRKILDLIEPISKEWKNGRGNQEY